MHEAVIRGAQKTFLALHNPYHSVEKVYPNIINEFQQSPDTYYLGVKNRKQIPLSLVERLKEKRFFLHTLDRPSAGGRAVDMHLINPITGRPMTGSSSGTALNVFLGINDLGIGTDGGGSVLGPALALALFGFICPLIEAEYLRSLQKRVSTDGLAFTPSIGYLSRSLALIREAAVSSVPGLASAKADSRIEVTCSRKESVPPFAAQTGIRTADYPGLDGERPVLISFLEENLKNTDVLISYEGPVDYLGLGDTIFGHHDSRTMEEQRRSGKGFIRAANMAGATALCIPGGGLSSGYVLLCQSKADKIEKMFHLASGIPYEPDALVVNYFTNVNSYFAPGFGETFSGE